jgi:hypothetical protein
MQKNQHHDPPSLKGCQNLSHSRAASGLCRTGNLHPAVPRRGSPWPVWLWVGLLALLVRLPVVAQTSTVLVYTNSFESYTNYAATNLTDTAYAFPSQAGPDMVLVANNPKGWAAGSGVQLINWLAHSGTQSLLVRGGAEADINLYQARSGSRYQIDFWLYVHKEGSAGNFYMHLGAMGADSNGDDYTTYRSDRAAGNKITTYNGIDKPVAWVNIGATNQQDVWQHHRLSVDTASRVMTVYIDDMTNPVFSGHIARPDVPVLTFWRLKNDGTTAQDWYAIDDLSLTVDNALTSLAAPFAEGFESYTTGTNPAGGPWITVASDGIGTSATGLNPSKVQVVDSSVATPHSGSKCIMLQGGQRAGVSLAFGTPPQSDVKITWWAKVPAAPAQSDAVCLRMSLYGAENGNTYSGDSALLGWGIRSGLTPANSTDLIYYKGSGWLKTGASYTPDTWEEYQIITANNLGTYTLVKNPSSYPQFLVINAPFVNGATNWGPSFMVAFSSSNGSGLPPAYVDDIKVESLVGSGMPLVYNPYAIQINGTRFTNSVVLKVGGPVGAATVDPRDNSTIVYATDDVSGHGGLFRVTKVAPGNWAPDPTPLATNLAAPSGLAIEPTTGNLWWVHDYVQSVKRLRWPWTTNTPELVVGDFVCSTNDPAAGAALDDDPCDCLFPPASFSGTISATWPSSVTWPTTVNSSYLVVLDRGLDFNANNTLFLVDPATTSLNQTNYDWYFYGPTLYGLGSGNMVGMTALPASGEIVTLCQDGQITAITGSGTPRTFWPEFYSDPYVQKNPAGIACDPRTGRLWIADQLWQKVYSCAPDGTDSRLELSFPLTETNRTDQALVMHTPGGGMTFAPDGSFLVFSDSNTGNGGGRLLILCNEPFTKVPFRLTGASESGRQAQVTWSSAGAAAYNVERVTNLTGGASFQTITTNVTALQFTDTNAPAAGAFYRVKATPTLVP